MWNASCGVLHVVCALPQVTRAPCSASGAAWSGDEGGAQACGLSVRDPTVVYVQHRQPLEMSGEPPGKVGVVPALARRPQHFGEGTQPGEDHVLRSLRD